VKVIFDFRAEIHLQQEPPHYSSTGENSTVRVEGRIS